MRSGGTYAGAIRINGCETGLAQNPDMRSTLILSLVPISGLLAACSFGPSRMETAGGALVVCLNAPGAICGDAFAAEAARVWQAMADAADSASMPTQQAFRPEHDDTPLCLVGRGGSCP